MLTKGLLIGSPTEGLTGCENDIALMKEVLSQPGAQLDVRYGKEATRDSILTGYRALIESAGSDDTVIVYYSGHGGIIANPEAGKPGEPNHYQCIVPWDFAPPWGAEFRGITGMELSELLAALTQKTKNVTVILDCCHSARMSRSLGARSRALRDPLPGDIRAHLARLRAAGIALKSGGPEGNPDAVRLVACGMFQSAWEYPSEGGNVCGAMTEAFHRAFREAEGSRVTWEALGRRVRDRVLSQFSAQRPEIEGPVTRYLFSTEVREKDGRLGVLQRPSGVFLQGGLVMDVRVGDTYDLYPQADNKPPFARAEVKRVGPATSLLALTPASAEIPEGAQAVLVKRTAGRAPISLADPEPVRSALARAVESCPLTKVAEENDTPLATLLVREGRLEIRDRSDALLSSPASVAAALPTLGASLRSIAIASAMRKLEGCPAAPFTREDYLITWGVVRDGQEVPLEQVGARLKSGASMFIRIENRGARTLYFTVFDIGVSQKVSLLSDSLPSGVPLVPGDPPYVLGLDESYVLSGWPVDWPQQVPVHRERDGGAREEELVVLITDRPQDFRPAETEGVRSLGKGRALTTGELDFAQIFSAVTREVDPKVPPAAYQVEHIQFYLEPPQEGAEPAGH